MGILTSLLGQGVDKSPSSDFWYLPIGGVSKAGVAVTEDSALKISAVLQGVRFISQTVAGLPRFIYRHLEDGRSREKDTKHPLNRILRFEPNTWQTSFQFVEMMTAHAIMRRMGIAEKIYDDRTGRLAALVPLDSRQVLKIEQRADGRLRYTYRRADGRNRIYLQEELFVLSGFGLSGITGLPLLEQMRDTAGLAIATEEFASTFFSNSAVPRVVLKHPGELGRETRDRIIESWNMAYGGVERSNKAAVLEDNMTLDVLSTDNEKSQMIETRKFLIAEFSRHTDVTPHRLSDMEKSSYNNVEQMSLETVVYTLTPWVKRWEQAWYRDGLDQDDKDSGRFVEYSLDGLLRGDTAARTEYYQSGIQNGWLTRNEAREKENHNPIVGLDAPLQPQNMVPIGPDGAPILPAAPKPERASAPEPVPEDDPQGGEGESRAMALARYAAGRVVRREYRWLETWTHRKLGDKSAWRSHVEAFYKDHVDYVRSELSIGTGRAEEWCSSRCQTVLEVGQEGLEAWRAESEKAAVEHLAMEALR